MASTKPLTKSLTKPLSSRRRKREQAILAAARQVFEARGYEQATMAEIAAEVGVVEGTVFHYFNSKRKLVLAVMEQFYHEITAAQADGLKHVQGLRNKLFFLIRFHLGMMNDNASLCGVILRESRGVDSELTKEIRRLNRVYTQPLRELLEAGASSGELREDTPVPVLRFMVYGAIEHALWNLLNEGQAIPVEAMAEELAAMVYAAVAPTQAAEQAELKQLVQRLNTLLD